MIINITCYTVFFFLSLLFPFDPENSLLPLAMFSRSLSCTLISMRKAPSAAQKQQRNTLFNLQNKSYVELLQKKAPGGL